ncbi:sigma factor regulator N-terminal domain-containing protein [Bacillus sp. Xin]|uniref:sigma factor regulator N-terminal domain-containing protein n=1 Tax=unclassified Bacillus (in: firmicutes) TaxID=185979 RepID=UPI0015726A0F|nr:MULTISPECIES: sigma factor regulator N-terminal domain-containing protein [unclassified Bacillus (in: firmicutes)]MBC6973209.1 sigma factor regulator N-terminal domain-containing protein [Bacillus sp. Xin]NSW36400.1 sigma factor regulator N-terminal domain-containing protein [Bacillus sp. Xin1]
MDTSLKDALKKAKRKQLFKTIIISIIVILILLPLFYKTGNYFAAKSSTKLHERLFLHNIIAEPNIQIDSQVMSNSSMFGGNIVTNRSKNINGYLVRWSTLTSSYDWLGINIDHNELIPGSYWSNTEFYEYDKQTKNKVATFYHPSIKKYYNGVRNDLGKISQMENYVAEVAISFNQPYTLKEIQEKIPGNLNIVWWYMTSPIVDESKGPAGVPVYGFNPSDSPKESYSEFIDALKKFDLGSDKTIQDFLRLNKNKQFDEVKILGMMLTGQTKNFKALENQDFIRGASVGATAQIVPYIKPEK